MGRTLNGINHSRFLLMLVLVIALVFAIAPKAFAGYLDGGNKEISNNGAAATIETQNPYVVYDSSAWVMTYDKNDTSGYKYAQVGYLKQVSDTKPYYFWEVSTSLSKYSGAKMTTYSTPANGSHHDYMVGCDSNYMYYKVDGTEITSPTLLSTYPFTRNAIQLASETQATNDQNPGSVSNPVTMGAIQYKSTSNVWTTTKCTNISNKNGIGYGTLTTQRNNISSSGASSWEVWDSRY
jgi:hypothetical protein